MTKKSSIESWYDKDTNTTQIVFHGFMRRDLFTKRLDYIRSLGAKFSNRDKAWIISGDKADEVKNYLDNFDYMTACEENAKAKSEPKEEPETETKTIETETVETKKFGKARSDELWQPIIDSITTLISEGFMDRNVAVEAIGMLEDAQRIMERRNMVNALKEECSK